MWSGEKLDICADRTPTSRMRRLGKYTRRGRMSQAPETDFFRYAQMLESCAAMLYESRKFVLEPSNASGRRVKGANVSHLVIQPLKRGRRRNTSSNNILSSLFHLKGLLRNCAIPLYPIVLHLRLNLLLRALSLPIVLLKHRSRMDILLLFSAVVNRRLLGKNFPGVRRQGIRSRQCR